MEMGRSTPAHAMRLGTPSQPPSISVQATHPCYFQAVQEPRPVRGRRCSRVGHGLTLAAASGSTVQLAELPNAGVDSPSLFLHNKRATSAFIVLRRARERGLLIYLILATKGVILDVIRSDKRVLHALTRVRASL